MNEANEGSGLKKVEFKVSPDETPLLVQWIHANPYVWSRAARDYLETALETGALPAIVPAKRRRIAAQGAPRRRRRGAPSGISEPTGHQTAAHARPETPTEPQAPVPGAGEIQQPVAPTRQPDPEPRAPEASAAPPTTTIDTTEPVSADVSVDDSVVEHAVDVPTQPAPTAPSGQPAAAQATENPTPAAQTAAPVVAADEGGLPNSSSSLPPSPPQPDLRSIARAALLRNEEI